MLHYETIEPATLELLKQLQEIPLLSETRLVGGTSLALQIGHRKSIDIDLFGAINCEHYELVDELSDLGDLKILKESKNIHVYQLNGVKLDIVNYKYPWMEPMFVEDNLRLADIKDIAAMKITAIIGRGTKKDFIDLAFLLDIFSLDEILSFYEMKYSEASRFMAMKSLVYFDDAERDPLPFMIKEKSWKDVKNRILREIQVC
ncbi:MAG: nucleotidyl transferase AbiEii/AbiGii toxin family protein [Bacteroidales bacterium]|nr:nucleotidyl transferase AbiEii/AbiGii toxin family protein [Bacteroidales bacterium]